MKAFHRRRALLIVCATALLTSCGATVYKPDPILISKYVAPAPPQPDETFVYVIRGRSSSGEKRGVWVAVNDRVVGRLENTSHMLLKLKSGVNTVHLVQALAGFAFNLLDNRPGETVFLSIDYAKGSMQEVSRDLGITMVMQTKVSEPLAETRENAGYDECVLNPGRLGLNLMRRSTTELLPDANSAIITFFRRDPLNQDIAFDVWDEASYVGSLKGGEYLQARAKPGRHIYFAKSQRLSVLTADIVAGKSYFVEYEVDRGWTMADVQLSPLNAVKREHALERLIEPLTGVALNAAILERPNVKTRLEKGNEYLNDARRKAVTGKLTSRKLTADMGR